MSVQKILLDIEIRAYKNDNNKPHTIEVQTKYCQSFFVRPSSFPYPSERLRCISYSTFSQMYELFSGTAVFCTA